MREIPIRVSAQADGLILTLDFSGLPCIGTTPVDKGEG